MGERLDVPFAFLHDLLDRAAEPSDRATARPPDEALIGARAAVLDATANVLAGLRQLLQATEDMVRLRHDRLIEEPARPAPRQEQRGRERVEITY